MAAQAIVHGRADSGQEPGPCRCEPRCSVRKRSYVRLGRVQGLDCVQPLRVELSCGGVDYWPCNCHRASKCAPCAEKFRRRLARKAEAGLNRSTGRLWLLTTTAPGVNDHARWDPGWARGVRAACGCHVGVDLAEWNAGASACWNRLRTALRRLYPDCEYLRSVEVQDGKRRRDGVGRGALHHHTLLWTPGAGSLDVLAVQDLAESAGYGCVIDLVEIEPGSRRYAYYVSKYVTKSCDARDDVPWKVGVVDEQTGELRRMHTLATFRTWSSSRNFGPTMKALKAAACVQARARAEFLRSLTPEELADLRAAGLLSSSLAQAVSSPP